MNRSNTLVLGIDASNIRGGGGVTHITEILNIAKPELHGFREVIIWGDSTALNLIEDRLWLSKKAIPQLFRVGFVNRLFWQIFFLSKVVKKHNCNVLFVPGGSYVGRFSPVVTMSQNLLPFEIKELCRYRKRIFFIKLLILRIIQSFTFKKVDGVIFLTKYAYKKVTEVLGALDGEVRIIPHGVNPRFNAVTRPQKEINLYDEFNPLKIIYVSTVDEYKHQWHVIEAISKLRSIGLPLRLDLIGSSYPPALTRLNNAIKKFDQSKTWVHYHGQVSFSGLHEFYGMADLGLFASSCENMPNILLEMMASGLPIASSNKGPMKEILQNAGLYFDPEDPSGIADVLYNLISNPELRFKLAEAGNALSSQYSWSKCSLDTFGFLSKVAKIER